MHELDYNLLSTSIINHSFEAAPAAGPLLIRIGHHLASTEPEEYKEVQSYVKRLLPELDSRGITEYALQISAALMVCFG